MINRLPPRFLNWRKLADGGKRPCNAVGRVINGLDPANHRTYAEALAAASPVSGLGVAFAIMPDDPFVFIDLDNARAEDGVAWAPWAMEVHQRLTGAACEMSQSRKGLHYLASCDKSALGERRKRWTAGPGSYEVYTSGRILSFGGHGWTGDPFHDVTAALDAWVPRPVARPADAVAGRCEVSDEVALARLLGMRTAAGTFDDGASPAALWRGDPAELARFYPDAGKPDGLNHSSADAALLAHLAFVCQRDPLAMERLFSRSGLVRPKWTDTADYRHRSIEGAIAITTNIASYAGMGVPDTVDVEPRVGIQQFHVGYLTVADQAKHFAGCVYVADAHRVMTPDGDMLRPDQFNVMFGGFEFAMQMDGAKPTKKAFDAFTENRARQFPKVTTSILQPDRPFGEIIGNAVNTYRAPPPRVPGDVSPFLEHLAYLIPNANDRALVLLWLAWVVQNPGKLSRWALVLVGPPGNGKTFLARCLWHAIGARYCHTVRPQDLGAQHNGWMKDTLFASVEEIDMGNRRGMLDDIKPYVTNDEINVRPMYADSVTITNRLNWILCTNHEGGVIKTADDRRFAIFHTNPQVQPNAHFDKLFAWASGGGFGYIADHLSRLPLTAFSHRAPHTSSTTEAIAASRGPIEAAIIEAIEDDRSGFRGGWVSGYAVRKLLDELGFKTPGPRVIPKALASIGYLLAGKSERDIPVEGRARLYQSGRERAAASAEYVAPDEYIAAQWSQPSDPASIVPFRHRKE